MAKKRKDDGRNLELIDALAVLERDKGIPAESIWHALEDALGAAYPKTPGVTATHARIEMDRSSAQIKVWEQEVDEETGEIVSENFVETPAALGRIAAQTAKQVITQRLREAEREITFEEYEGREGDIIMGTVEQHDPRATVLSLGKADALMPQGEQVPRERYEVGDRVRGYICEVRRTLKGPTIIVSRTHPGLVRKLFEMEVPEIQDGLVEIRAIAREAGHRTKIAVASNDLNIDPVGACVGPKGARVRAVQNELRGEKIDIVPWRDDPAKLVAEALQPARVRDVVVDEANKTAVVVVPDNQLSLAIGKEGQNARLAARLTGWRIDIKSESQYSAGPAQPDRGLFEPVVPESRRRGIRSDSTAGEQQAEATDAAPGSAAPESDTTPESEATAPEPEATAPEASSPGTPAQDAQEPEPPAADAGETGGSEVPAADGAPRESADGGVRP
ncbi:MAG TPA: transcription termination factor NusA [Actinomycetota bacterium]|nr:transcription termination factor NusA [Actinomycetota bacterium]